MRFFGSTTDRGSLAHLKATIAVGQYDDISGFVRYLGHMLARDWHTEIPGTNISVLKKHI